MDSAEIVCTLLAQKWNCVLFPIEIGSVNEPSSPLWMWSGVRRRSAEILAEFAVLNEFDGSVRSRDSISQPDIDSSGAHVNIGHER